MGQPLFLLQIVDASRPDHPVIRIPGGGTLEREFIAHCASAIVKRKVGWLRTEAHVKQAIIAGIHEAILDLKQETQFVVS